MHSKQSGTQPKANKNFSPDLLELCRSVLGWNIERKVTKTGKFIRVLRLRTEGDGNYPTHDYNLMQLLTGGDESGDGSGDGSEHLPDKDLSKGDGSTQTSLESLEIENQLDYEQKINNEDKSFSVIPLKSLLTKGSDPSPLPVTSSVTNTNEIDEPPQPKTPRLEEGLSDTDKLSRLTKNRRHYPMLWYTGIEDIPRRLRFRSVELWFDEQTVIAFPDGWQSPQRFVLNEIEFVTQP